MRTRPEQDLKYNAFYVKKFIVITFMCVVTSSPCIGSYSTVPCLSVRLKYCRPDNKYPKAKSELMDFCTSEMTRDEGC